VTAAESAPEAPRTDGDKPRRTRNRRRTRGGRTSGDAQS